MAISTERERYRDLKPLGTGGMGMVTLAEDQLLGRQVALKRLHPHHDVAALSRLRREALIGASINHPNLVSIFDVLTDEEGVVVVMEYVPGETLAAKLAREGRLPAAQALPILQGAAAGLDAIHARGIVHRDVKPANVLLGEDGAVKLADLGVAAMTDGTRITSAGTVLGSWRYMAPEQLEGETSTPALDIYALAAVAYETLSGRPARREQNPLALAHAIATQPPPDLQRDWPQAPAAAAEVLSQGMARDRAARPSSATELVKQLAATFEPPAPKAVAPAPAPRAVAAAAAAPRPAGAPPRVAVPARPAAPVAFSSSRRGRVPWIPILLAAVVAAAVVAVVLSNSAGNSTPKRSAAAGGAGHRTAHHHKAAPRPSATHSSAAATATAPASSSGSPTGGAASAPAAGSASGSAASGGGGAGAAGSAANTVQRFYSLAAAHDYAAAWALADPSLRNQLGGYSSFQAGQSGDRSITFRSLNTQQQSGNSATVALQTTSVRTDGTHQCGGTADLVRTGSGAGWLMHLIHINCS